MSIQKGIFKLYIFLLPFMLFPFLNAVKNLVSSSASVENDLFLLLIGLFLLIIVQNGKIKYNKSSLTIKGIVLCMVLIAISTLTSLILYLPFGRLNGENTILASISPSVYLVITAITFYYNSEMFKHISKQEIKKILSILVYFLLVLGYIQIAVILIPSIGRIYDGLDILNILTDSTILQSWGRICLTGSEPSSVGNILNVLIYPYILSVILEYDEKRYKIIAILFLPLIYFTYSSTVYIGTLVNLLVFVFIKFKRRKSRKEVRNGILIVMIILILGILGGGYLWNQTIVGKTIQEYVINKTSSGDDLSSMIRYSSVLTDIKAFLHYPLTGVGNGNQGYFYNETCYEHYSRTVLSYEEFSSRLNGSMGIVNGGPFVPAFISGYGILGIVLATRFIRLCVRRMEEFPLRNGNFRYMYYIGGFSFLILTTVSGGLDGNFLAIFVLSIPFMESMNELVYKEVGNHEQQIINSSTYTYDE